MFIGALVLRKHKQFDGFHDGIRHLLDGCSFLERALTLQKLGVGNEREGAVRAQLRTASEFLKAATRHLPNASMLVYYEPTGGEGRDRLANRRELPANVAGRGPVVKHRRKSVQPITERASDKRIAAATENPAKFLDACLSIPNVMPNMRQPNDVAALVHQRNTFGGTDDVREIGGLPSASGSGKHAPRWLDPNNMRSEGLGEQR